MSLVAKAPELYSIKKGQLSGKEYNESEGFSKARGHEQSIFNPDVGNRYKWVGITHIKGTVLANNNLSGRGVKYRPQRKELPSAEIPNPFSHIRPQCLLRIPLHMWINGNVCACVNR